MQNSSLRLTLSSLGEERRTSERSIMLLLLLLLEDDGDDEQERSRLEEEAATLDDEARVNIRQARAEFCLDFFSFSLFSTSSAFQVEGSCCFVFEFFPPKGVTASTFQGSI